MDYQKFLRECAPDLLPARTQIFDHIATVYGVTPEFPWLQYPLYGTFKHPTSHKWFAIIMHIKAQYLGLTGSQMVDVINVKIDPARLPLLIDRVHVFPAYHMNKKYWVTVLIDATTDYPQLFTLLDQSYQLVA